ncbi:UDP-glycosyltransferase [Nymphaea thermarum]|nr:UDP-glycosyltransferase [Nymphaea thermarum]
MEFAHRLAEEGFMVTFVNTDFIHSGMVKSLPETFTSEYSGRIRLASIPDGVDSQEDRWNFKEMSNAILHVMPRFLEELILKEDPENGKITFMMVDGMIGTLLSVAVKLEIRRAVFWPASAWFLAIFKKIPFLLASGTIDENGKPSLGRLDPAHLCWMNLRDSGMSSAHFRYLNKCVETIKGIDHIVCNSFSKLKWPFLEIISGVVPIGLLMSANHSKLQSSSFWKEDWSCLDWLDQFNKYSCLFAGFVTIFMISFNYLVILIDFIQSSGYSCLFAGFVMIFFICWIGMILMRWTAVTTSSLCVNSTTMLNQRQIDELALSLELTERLFLWVCRPGVMDKEDALYPEGFMDRITSHGLVVGWAPQQEVLAHPSVPCFLTHCGWNSTMEGLSNGVPMLCWPYIGDQFQNQSYIVHIWKVGLSLTQGCDELVTKEEIKSKLEALLSDHGIKERVVELKKQGEMSMIEGGDSFRRFHDFVSVIKGEL